MARKGDIEIPIAVDTGGVEKQIQNGLVKPIETADKALDKLGKTDAGRDIDKELGKAQTATEDLSRELDKTRTDLDKLGFAGRDAGREGQDGLRKIGSTGAEVGGELKQNLGETFASFRGDLRDLPQIAQDTLGGLAGSGALGGIPGLAATAAGAAGLGLIIGAFDAAGAEAEETARRVEEAYGKQLEAGSRYVTQKIVLDNLGNMSAEDRNKALERANQLGIEGSTILRAQAGDQDAIAAIQGEMNRRKQEEIEKIQESGASLEEQSVKVDAVNTKYAEQLDWIRDANREQATVTAQVEATVAAMAAMASPLDIAQGKVDGIKGSLSEVLGYRQLTLDVGIDLTRARSEINNWRPVVYLQGEVVRSGKIEMY
jgi:hypothetical protein